MLGRPRTIIFTLDAALISARLVLLGVLELLR